MQQANTIVGCNDLIIRTIISHICNSTRPRKWLKLLYNCALINTTWNAQTLPFLYKNLKFENKSWEIITHPKRNLYEYRQNISPYVKSAAFSNPPFPFIKNEPIFKNLFRLMTSFLHLNSLEIPGSYIQLLLYTPSLTTLTINHGSDTISSLYLHPSYIAQKEWIMIGSATPKLSKFVFSEVMPHTNFVLTVKQWTLREFSYLYLPSERPNLGVLLEAITATSQCTLESIDISKTQEPITLNRFKNLKKLSIEGYITHGGILLDSICAPLVYLRVESVEDEENFQAVHRLLSRCANTIEALDVDCDSFPLDIGKYFDLELPKLHTLCVRGYKVTWGYGRMERPSINTFKWYHARLTLVTTKLMIEAFPNLRHLTCGKILDSTVVKMLLTKLSSLESLNVEEVDLNALISAVNGRTSKLIVRMPIVLARFGLRLDNKPLSEYQRIATLEMLVDCCEALTCGKLRLFVVDY